MIPAALLIVLAVSAPAENRCTLCHPDIRVQFERSIHKAEQVSCTACHGGDDRAVTVEGAHRGFKGVPRRKDVPALCASCHADAEKMRAYNLPSDQYALYLTSRHGRRLAEGDDHVAVCTDCHGSHEILAPGNPASPVYARNIPKTCGRCHADPALRERYGWKEDLLAEYATGVHGQALLEKGNASAPDCTRCHGAHGAAPPGVGDVDKICGQCHETTRVYFSEGPHKAAMDAAGLPECASCHNPHATARTDVKKLGEVCGQCHAADSPPARIAEKVTTLYTRAEEELNRARGLVDRAARVPLYVEDYRSRLEEGHTSLLESLPVIHALDVGRVERFTSRARGLGNEVESEVSGKLDELKWRRVGLLVFWFYLLITVALLVRLRRRAPASGTAR